MKIAKDLVKEDYAWLDYSDTLSHAMGRLKNEMTGEALVFKDETLAGIFSPSFTVRSKLDFMKAKVGNFSRPVPIIDAQEKVDEVARMMLAAGINVLPVTERGRMLGSIHTLDLISHFAEQNNSASLSKVYDEIIPKRLMTLSETDKFGKAVQLFHKTSYNAFMLVDENGQPSDVLTRYDLMHQIQLHSHKREHAGRPRMQQKAFKSNLPDIDALPLSNFVQYRNKLVLMDTQTVKEALSEMSQQGRLSFLVNKKDEIRAMNAKDLLKYYVQTPSRAAREGQRSAATESA